MPSHQALTAISANDDECGFSWSSERAPDCTSLFQQVPSGCQLQLVQAHTIIEMSLIGSHARLIVGALGISMTQRVCEIESALRGFDGPLSSNDIGAIENRGLAKLHERDGERLRLQITNYVYRRIGQKLRKLVRSIGWNHTDDVRRFGA